MLRCYLGCCQAAHHCLAFVGCRSRRSRRCRRRACWPLWQLPPAVPAPRCRRCQHPSRRERGPCRRRQGRPRPGSRGHLLPTPQRRRRPRRRLQSPRRKRCRRRLSQGSAPTTCCWRFGKALQRRARIRFGWPSRTPTRRASRWSLTSGRCCRSGCQSLEPGRPVQQRHLALRLHRRVRHPHWLHRIHRLQRLRRPEEPPPRHSRLRPPSSSRSSRSRRSKPRER
mmetsp:Transcript_42786/g.124390  ORF Transcript_42786/g.124390 Transcript_42786/m.124390 type:complete len:225 (-) Transcript_42786:510-1184(-)